MLIMAQEESVGEFLMPPYKTHGREKYVPVEYVFHATHVEFAVDMLQGEEERKFIVNFKAMPSVKKHNAMEAGKYLLFFGCELGSGWDKETSRYGNVLFKFRLEDVLAEFQKQEEGKLLFYALGTSKYKQEYSHKVLVASSSNPDPFLKKLRLLKRLPDNKYLPLRQRGELWEQQDSQGKEQQEFVLFQQENSLLTLPGEMKFISHQDLCIPLKSSTRKPEHCNVSCSSGTWNNDERSNKIEAKIEFTACILVKEKTNLFEIFMKKGDETNEKKGDETNEKGDVKLLAETMTTMWNEASTETGNAEIQMAKYKRWPKFYFSYKCFKNWEKCHPEAQNETSALQWIKEEMEWLRENKELEGIRKELEKQSFHQQKDDAEL